MSPDPGDLRNRLADQRLHREASGKAAPGTACFDGDYAVHGADQPQAAAARDHRRQHAAVKHGLHPWRQGRSRYRSPAAGARGPGIRPADRDYRTERSVQVGHQDGR